MPLLKVGWHELAVVAAITLFAISPLTIWERRETRRWRRLAASGELSKWANENWRRVIKELLLFTCVSGPFEEELLFRGPVVLVLYFFGWIPALVIGWILNLIFALLHSGGARGSRRDHQAWAFVLGLIPLAAVLTTGWLSACVLLHAITNFVAGGGRTMLVALQKTDEEVEGAKLYLRVDKRRYEVALGPSEEV